MLSFCLVKMRAVGTVAVRFCYDSEELLKQIELVRGKVIEVASACNIGLKPPRKIAAALIVEVAERYGKSYLNIDYLSQNARIKY